MEVTDELIDLFGKVWDKTSHTFPGDRRRAALRAVFAELEKDYVSRWESVSSGSIPAELLKYNPEILDHLKLQVQDQAKYMGCTIPDIDAYETIRSEAAFAMDYVTLKWKMRRD